MQYLAGRSESSVNERESGSQAIVKVTKHLIPFMFLLYITAYIDRINVGFAALQMNAELGFNDTVFGLGAGVFFLGYFIFQVPSNLIMQKLGARKWISVIMVVWGVIAAGMSLVRDPDGFYLLRFLLGIAEAGFFPGMILYLTTWFPPDRRAGATALFMAAAAVAGVVSGPVSGALLTMHGTSGLSGWQWLFLLEGAPAVLLGFITSLYLTNTPAEAKWLTEEEKAWLIRRMDSGGGQEKEGEDGSRECERREIVREGRESFLRLLADGRVWSLSALYLTVMIGMYGVNLWLPQIIKFFSHYHNLVVGIISVVPYLLAVTGMTLIGRHSDRCGGHRLIVALLLCVGSASLLILAYTRSSFIALSLLSAAAVGIYAALGPFWALSTIYLRKGNSAAGIAVINSVGNLGGFIGPYIVGVIKGATGDFTGSLIFLGLSLATGSLTAFALRTASRR